MARDLVISCFAGGLPDGLDWPNGAPGLLEWPGQSRIGAHPTWGDPAARLRTGGRLLGPLLRRYPVVRPANVGRIALVGFSAGFGGVRELLRSEADAAEIDTVILIDTLHFPIKRPRELEHPRQFVAAWSETAEPFARFAVAAALGERLWVSTWGDIPAPGKRITSAAEGNWAILVDVLEQTAADGGDVRSTAGFPPRTTSKKLQPDELYPVPSLVWGLRDAVGLYYPSRGSLRALKRSHVIQAQVIRPDVLRYFLGRRWGAAEVCALPACPETERARVGPVRGSR